MDLGKGMVKERVTLTSNPRWNAKPGGIATMKHKRSSKTMVEDLKKGQPKVNAFDQKKGCYLEVEDLHQTLKILIRL
ncbi:hypothetical protein MTR_3g019660 [Medicago truncatula]|uniref:Uncharacterized protein n=1 Tax=Medicago truncatula TaxID=3880 RepID=G7IYY9_MEDTR|nr:hypothetical protein MTR_3g019660 [Medicago truncatula]